MKRVVLIVGIVLVASAAFLFVTHTVSKRRALEDAALAPLSGEIPGPSSVVYTDVYFAKSADGGKSWTDATLGFRNATEPDLVVLEESVGDFKKGWILVYYTDYASLDEEKPALKVAYSKDGGKNWSSGEPIGMWSNTFFDPESPSVVERQDGSVRMFFTGYMRSGGEIAKKKKEKYIMSATSEDGVQFLPEDNWRLKGESFLDPELQVDDGQEILFFGRGSQTLLATTEDGMNFSVVSKPMAEGGTPGVVEYNDQTLLFASYTGIVRAVSVDGMNFSDRQTVLVDETKTLSDPSVVVLPDGTLLMAYSVHE